MAILILPSREKIKLSKMALPLSSPRKVLTHMTNINFTTLHTRIRGISTLSPLLGMDIIKYTSNHRIHMHSLMSNRNWDASRRLVLTRSPLSVLASNKLGTLWTSLNWLMEIKRVTWYRATFELYKSNTSQWLHQQYFRYFRCNYPAIRAQASYGAKFLLTSNSKSLLFFILTILWYRMISHRISILPATHSPL